MIEEHSGLTRAQVAERVAAGKVNISKEPASRTLGQIIRGNIFTLFNGILAVALVVVLAVGELQDAVFGLVIIFNAAIGVFQEYRAKRTLDKLAILDTPPVQVRRDGEVCELDPEELVADDVLSLRIGDQVPTDAVVLEARSMEIDESLLTGESDPLVKNPGDEVMSGSFVVAGSGWVRATRVGAEGYANQLTAQARRFSLVHSELRSGVNQVLVWITWIIGPVIALLIWSQVQAHGGWSTALADGSWRSAVVGAVAGIVGMIPEGLVLLTSISFGLAAITLARRQVLVQELPAVEVLARVDVICLDKTGTLTEGEIIVEEIEDVEPSLDPIERDQVLAALAQDPDANATTKALRGLDLELPSHVAAEYTVPFSSARKWSALNVDGTHWVLGAPEVVLHGDASAEAGAALEISQAAARDGRRAVLLARSASAPSKDTSLGSVTPVAIIKLRERIRSDAAETLKFFAEQGVALRVISGDNPVTVAAVAREVGLEDAIGYDARELPEDIEAMADVLENNRVFGRVTPEQKRSMVHALQHRGHTVAMTGDGVNDALALKDADLGIAMGSGAGVTKAVARLVLLDGKFSRLPGVVAEGRRVIANIERVANLYLTKTSYAILISISIGLIALSSGLFGFEAWPYPFLPRHLTVIGALTIGIPSFFLAIAPNSQRYKPGFLKRVLSFAVPSGIIAGVTTLAVYGTMLGLGQDQKIAATVATLTMICIGLWILSVLARPWVWWKVALVVAMAIGAVLVLSVPFLSWFYQLSWPTGMPLVAVAIAAVVGCTGVELSRRFITPWLRRDNAKTSVETNLS